jgi:hypothetical protein
MGFNLFICCCTSLALVLLATPVALSARLRLNAPYTHKKEASTALSSSSSELSSSQQHHHRRLAGQTACDDLWNELLSKTPAQTGIGIAEGIASLPAWGEIPIIGPFFDLASWALSVADSFLPVPPTPGDFGTNIYNCISDQVQNQIDAVSGIEAIGL